MSIGVCIEQDSTVSHLMNSCSYTYLQEQQNHNDFSHWHPEMTSFCCSITLWLRVMCFLLYTQCCFQYCIRHISCSGRSVFLRFPMERGCATCELFLREQVSHITDVYRITKKDLQKHSFCPSCGLHVYTRLFKRGKRSNALRRNKCKDIMVNHIQIQKCTLLYTT